MTTKLFNRMCERLTQIAHYNEPYREDTLNVFMSQGFLFLELTNKQVDKIKNVFKTHFPDIYKEYPTPDEHGFTSEFKYLRFK